MADLPSIPAAPAGISASILADHRRQLLDAQAATEQALRQLKGQLAQLERNQIAIAAQRSLLDSLEQAASVDPLTP